MNWYQQMEREICTEKKKENGEGENGGYRFRNTRHFKQRNQPV
jgi:hypothetical protein